MTLQRICLLVGLVVFLFAMVLGFGWLNDPSLEGEWPGFLCLGLALVTAAKL